MPSILYINSIEQYNNIPFNSWHSECIENIDNSHIDELKNKNIAVFIEEETIKLYMEFNTMNAILPHFRENNNGTIINCTSRLGLTIDSKIELFKLKTAQSQPIME